MQDSPARAALDVGSVIAGTYTIEALVGRGGMGAVFLASHNRLPGKKVAIKVLHPEVANEDLLARFKREAQIAATLGHPNIVGVENFDVMSDGTPFLVMEYLQGETLADRMKRGPLGLDTSTSILRQVGSALAAAHRAGIVHRDLKPQNIFLVPTEFDGKQVEVAKVLDFGISKMRGSQTVKTHESALLGTPQYMAPEQATGRHAEVDARTDIFALGAIVYEMLAGQPAFDGQSIPEVVFKVVYEQPKPLAELAGALPANVVAAVGKAMAKQPAERFANVGEMVEAVSGRPLATRVPSVPSVMRRPVSEDALAQTVSSQNEPVPAIVKEAAAAPATVRDEAKKPRRVAVGVAAGCMVIAVVIGGMWMMRSPSPSPSPSVTPTPSPNPSAATGSGSGSATATVTATATATATAAAPAPAPVAAPAPPPRAVAPPPREVKAPASEPDDGCGEKIAAAQAALEAKEYTRARMLANTALNMQGINDAHKMHAAAILGIVGCIQDNSDEAALIQLNKIHDRRYRKQLVDGCHAVGRLAGTQ